MPRPSPGHRHQADDATAEGMGAEKKTSAVHVTARAQRRQHQIVPGTRHPVDDLAHLAQRADVRGDDATGGDVRADVRQR